MKIWKTRLRVIDAQEIEVPAGTQFLRAREQGDEVCVWYKCDPDKPMEKAIVYLT